MMARVMCLTMNCACESCKKVDVKAELRRWKNANFESLPLLADLGFATEDTLNLIFEKFQTGRFDELLIALNLCCEQTAHLPREAVQAAAQTLFHGYAKVLRKKFQSTKMLGLAFTYGHTSHFADV